VTFLSPSFFGFIFWKGWLFFKPSDEGGQLELLLLAFNLALSSLFSNSRCSTRLKSVRPHHNKFLEYHGLLKLIRVERIRNEIRTDKFSNETRYSITSLDKNIEFLAKSIRSHWSIENNLHWVLDVEFKEDACRKRTGNQASNFSLIRKIAFNLINEKKGKKSINAVRMACALSDSERQNILGITLIRQPYGKRSPEYTFDSYEYEFEINNKKGFIELKVLKNKESEYLLRK